MAAGRRIPLFWVAARFWMKAVGARARVKIPSMRSGATFCCAAMAAIISENSLAEAVAFVACGWVALMSAVIWASCG